MNLTPANILEDHSAILAHCSAFQNMSVSSETAQLGRLERLHFTIEHRPELSCSTVQPGDMIGPQRRNYVGPIGLIIDPFDLTNITHTSPQDGGTDRIPNTLRRNETNSRREPNDLRDAIHNRPFDEHNEICVNVSSYKILGVILLQPLQFTDGQTIPATQILPQFEAINQPIFLRDSSEELIHRVDSQRRPEDNPIQFNQFYERYGSLGSI